MPSPCSLASLGLSFVAAGEIARPALTAGWGRYERLRVEDDAYRNPDGAFRLVWRRIPVEAVSPPIPLRAGKTAPWVPNPDHARCLRSRPGAAAPDGQWHITLFLVNGQQEPEKASDEAWLFQPELGVVDPRRRGHLRAPPAAPRPTGGRLRPWRMHYRATSSSASAMASASMPTAPPTLARHAPCA